MIFAESSAKCTTFWLKKGSWFSESLSKLYQKSRQDFFSLLNWHIFLFFSIHNFSNRMSTLANCYYIFFAYAQIENRFKGRNGWTWSFLHCLLQQHEKKHLHLIRVFTIWIRDVKLRGILFTVSWLYLKNKNLLCVLSNRLRVSAERLWSEWE